MIVPASHHICLHTITLGVIRAFEEQKSRVGHYKPVMQHLHDEASLDHSIDMREIESLLSVGQGDVLLERIVEDYKECEQDNDVVIVQGLKYELEQLYVTRLNLQIAHALDAKVILVVSVNEKKPNRWVQLLSIKASGYKKRLFQCIVDRAKAKDLIDFHLPLLAYLPHTDHFDAQFVAKQIQSSYIKEFLSSSYERHISPPAFRNQLIQSAREANKRIVLPEGEDLRTIEAANIVVNRNIACCVLLGNPKEIKKLAKKNKIDLSEKVEIVDPDVVLENYINAVVELRKHKGMTPEIAHERLQDTVELGTMMLQCGEVDGLVSGAIHTTANTIRPALQLIKTKPGTQLVSSIFFMCLPEQVVVYGDCGVNTNPDEEELADIAIQSADSAKAFGIEPRVAMISYSTGASGKGEDVVKVLNATKRAQEKRPDLVIDGPLQYDAAFVPEVAKLKAPDSPVAGRATVFVFPDLNTGNTVYKAVQRTGNIVCMGPMLQGLRKPVNDLSRGCLVEDIVFTIALTAIQASFPG